jgi:hypothetical protein
VRPRVKKLHEAPCTNCHRLHRGRRFRGNRLRFWQEQEWERFIAANPEFAVGMDQLAVAIRVCEIHGDELLPVSAKVIHGQVDYADSYEKPRNEQFPHAASQPT